MALLSYTLAGVAAIAGLVVLSAFFSSSETAIFTLSDEWVAAQSSDGNDGVSTIRALRGDPTASS